ncbi:Exonuclease 1 [Papilio machaon]|uniref:Exonuclease 1 n=1 Tax=Papilio machaon TaxID=76193 RepID=A0A194R3G9_PAPMA|nr:Exonuclease 1 [Papilio machaon]
MGITGLIPFLEKASRRANVGEFNGCTVAIDSYCWLHKGAFACADKLVQGLETDIYVKYCLKYVTMLISKNIKPIMVFDGRHLPAKAMTELKRRESRQLSKKRAAELLSLGQMEEARSYMRRSVDVTHEMALALIKECRNRNVDCIVAPYEADAQLAYLNINNIAQLVITEDSDLILFGCTKVLFKMDLDGTGTLVETVKLPLVMKCAIESYTFDKFRQMCIMSGCDYLASLPGIGLAKARQFVVATQDPNFANALRKLPSFFNRLNLVVTDEYRENFLKAEATFKHQYVYDPLERRMVRLTDIDDEDLEKALCVNAGELLDPKIAYQLALGNLDPFSLKKMDDWDPDNRQNEKCNIKTSGWNEKPSNHPSIWNEGYRHYLKDPTPWLKKIKKVEPIIAIPQTRVKKKIVNLVSKYVPETQDMSLTIESLNSMYCVEPSAKKQKNNNTSDTEIETESQKIHNIALTEDDILDEKLEKNKKSPIIENRKGLNRKFLNNSSFSVLKRLSKFPRTILGDNVIESKFFTTSKNGEKNQTDLFNNAIEIDTQCSEIPNTLKENSQFSNTIECKKSPILEPKYKNRNPFKKKEESQLSSSLSDDSVIDNTYPMENLVTPVDTQESFGDSQPQISSPISLDKYRVNTKETRNGFNGIKKSSCKVSGLKRTTSLPSNQPTLLSKFGFQKKPVLKK